MATIDSGGVPASNRLGGIAVSPGGTLYVARLGHGRAAAVFRVGTPSRAAGAIVRIDLATGRVTAVVEGLGEPVGPPG